MRNAKLRSMVDMGRGAMSIMVAKQRVFLPTGHGKCLGYPDSGTTRSPQRRERKQSTLIY